MVIGLAWQLIQGYYNFYNLVSDSVYSFYLLNSRAILDFLHIVFKGAFNMLLIITMVLATAYLIVSIIVALDRRKKAGKKPADYWPSVTVQIPTFNETAALNCARRCLGFDYPKEKLQIMIGDDSSDRKVSAEIDRFASRHPENVLVTRRGSNAGFKPGNLNYMLKQTKGEIIVIFDSDFLPEKDFLKRIVAPFRSDSNISVVQARWRLSNFDQNIVSVLGGSISMVCHNIFLAFINRFARVSFLCGSAEAIRKRDLIGVGGWQSGSLTEDIECSLRLMKKGRRLVYLEDLCCDCEVPFTFRDLAKQQMRWAYGVILAMKTHFFGILGSRRMGIAQKLSVLGFVSGYMFSFLLLGVAISGFLSLLSDTPAPVDWARFLGETGKNILLTSGFLVSTVIAMTLGRKAEKLPKMLFASLSIGLVITYYVNIGIFKALFGRRMHWFMISKNGNSSNL